MSDTEMIEKYEAWIARLQQNVAAMERQRRTFRIMFFGAVVLSALGFLWGTWLGVATFLTGIMVCGAGLYITMTREWEYEREIERTRGEVQRLRGA